MCEELFGKENLAVKFSLEKNTLSPKEFMLIQEFYAWLAAQQMLALDPPSALVCNCGSVAGIHCDWCPCANAAVK